MWWIGLVIRQRSPPTGDVGGGNFRLRREQRDRPNVPVPTKKGELAGRPPYRAGTTFLPSASLIVRGTSGVGAGSGEAPRTPGIETLITEVCLCGCHGGLTHRPCSRGDRLIEPAGAKWC